MVTSQTATMKQSRFQKIVQGKIDGWSAMQKCTAMPVCAVSEILLAGEIKKKGHVRYEDIPYKKFMHNLQNLMEKADAYTFTK